MDDASDYCKLRRHRLLRDFDSYVKYVRPVLAKHFGEEAVNELVLDTRRGYDSLIPRLPDG
jgi:hypothetical protein